MADRVDTQFVGTPDEVAAAGTDAPCSPVPTSWW